MRKIITVDVAAFHSVCYAEPFGLTSGSKSHRQLKLFDALNKMEVPLSDKNMDSTFLYPPDPCNSRY